MTAIGQDSLGTRQMLDVGGKSARLAHMSHDYNITVRVWYFFLVFLSGDCGLTCKVLMV